jgi:mono/diheme cytochrome c family protein
VQSGPSLYGVGAASVDFQVGTGGMPAQASGPADRAAGPAVHRGGDPALAAYVATAFGPGPAIPDGEYLDPANGDVAEGAELFRVNCAMCHNFAGSGGALTQGKYAPPIINVAPVHVYEAMLTGPQSMPVFNDQTLSPQQKNDIITYLAYIKNTPQAGGLSLGSIGPSAKGSSPGSSSSRGSSRAPSGWEPSPHERNPPRAVRRDEPEPQRRQQRAGHHRDRGHRPGHDGAAPATGVPRAVREPRACRRTSTGWPTPTPRPHGDASARWRPCSSCRSSARC